MPRKDGTGPSGKGGMTGRGGRMRLTTNSTDKELLLEQKKILKHQLATINKQLDKYSNED